MTKSYVRLAGAWRALGLQEETDPDPPSEDRPALSSPPDASTTGPRVSVSGPVLSSSQAINAAIANGGVLTGRYISSLTLKEPEHGNLVFQDCIIGDTLGGGSTYVVNGWFSSHPRPTDGSRATFHYCRLIGGASSTIVGWDWRLLNCELYGGVDLVKAFGNNEMYGCFAHDTWHPDGAHADVIQYQTGDDVLIHWNNLQGFNHPNSPSSGGAPANAVLQSGGVLGDETNFRMLDNWVDGGHYTLRGAPSGSGYVIDQVFRRNKHGRNFTWGAITNMGTDGVDYDSSNVWQDDGQPVLGG